MNQNTLDNTSTELNTIIRSTTPSERKNKALRDSIFEGVNNFILFIVGISCLLPVMYVIAISLSSSTAIATGKVAIWPVDFTLEAYKYLLGLKEFIGSYFNTFYRTILGVSLTLLIVVLTAYPLSKEKENLKGRDTIMWYLYISMFLNGGLLPSYMIVKTLGWIDSIWALIIPDLLVMGHVILFMNFLRSLPKELEEAAYMDGAGHFIVLFKIYLPISKAALATIALFCIVTQWNSWFDGLIYINKIEKLPLASYLRLLISPDSIQILEIQNEKGTDLSSLGEENIKAAQIIAAILPILCAYPFLQKYFAKGIVMGSVKG